LVLFSKNDMRAKFVQGFLAVASSLMHWLTKWECVARMV
jgi:hypothetical protein